MEAYFDSISEKGFSEKTFSEKYYANREIWKIPEQKTSRQAIQYLLSKNLFIEHIITDERNHPKKIYSWKTNDDFVVISALKAHSYLAYYTSVFLHQLTLQLPKTIYLNFEHSHKTDKVPDNRPTQITIDKAFSQGQRKSSLSFFFKERKIIITNGQYTRELGVITASEGYRYTDLERTLIDIAVRPVYAGGVFEVLEAFKRAKEKVDVTKLASYLETLDYIYPYHQVIGFYMEKAGFDKEALTLFKKDMAHNFYLTYDIRNKEFSTEWKLFYPKGFN